MAIKVIDKYLDTVNYFVKTFNLKEKKVINKIEELKQILVNTSNCAEILYNCTIKNKLEKVIGTYKLYDNGINVLNADLIYKVDDGTKHYLKNIVVFSNKQELVNISTDAIYKSIQEMFISSCYNNNYDKQIGMFKTMLFINKDFYNTFETIIDFDKDSIIVEKYRHFEHTSNNTKSNELFKKCGCDMRDLEISYLYEKPVFVQFSDDKKLEDIGYNSYNASDVKKVIRIINGEITQLMKLMYNTMSISLENNNNHKKLQKRL